MRAPIGIAWPIIGYRKWLGDHGVDYILLMTLLEGGVSGKMQGTGGFAGDFVTQG